MEKLMTFGEVLEAIAQLSLLEQESLLEVVHQRVIEQRRVELAQEIQEARQEFEAGQCRPTTPNELMAEILA